MKLLWMLVVIVFGGAMVLTSCEDDKDSEQTVEDQTTGVPMSSDQTADQLDTKIDALTYVFDATYTGEGAALVRRVVKRTQNILDPNIRNIIIHSSNVSKININEAIAISAVIIKGGSVVMVEPTPKEEVALMNKIIETADDCITGTIESELFDNLDYDNLEWLYGWAIQGTKTIMDDYNIDPDDKSLEIMGWREFLIYKSLNVHEDETYTKSMECIFTNEDGTTTTEPLTFDEKVEMTDYLFGLQADECAEWMNIPPDVEAQRAARRTAVKAISQRANESEQYIDQIATAQEYNLQIGGIVTFKDGSNTISRYHKVLINRKVWAAYSFNKKRDFYCINQTVRLYNQDLKCGPVSKGEWWNSKDWDKWKAATKDHPMASARVYGPYLRQFGMEMYMKDEKPTIERSVPVNSTSGSETVSNGISISLGANIGFSGANPAGGVSGSVSWSHSVSRVNEDLKMTATTNTSKGTVNWQYDLNSLPKSEYKLLGADHTSARDVATKELELQQAWVWSIQSNGNSVDVVTDWTMTDEWLSYEKTVTSFKTREFYIDEKFSNTDLKSQKATQENHFTFDRIQRISCPPRVRENWSMTIEGDGLTGDQKTKVENFLLDHLSQYYTKSFILFSAQHGHKKAIVDGKMKLETLDELGRRVAKLKKAMEVNNNVAELFKLAGRDAGIPSTGSYKIVWRYTDDNLYGAKYENEELTINLSDAK